MNRRDFIKSLGVIGSVSILPAKLPAKLPANTVPELNYYPKISYDMDYRFDLQAYVHQVSGRTESGDKWAVIEYAEGKELSDELYLSMVDKLIKELI